MTKITLNKLVKIINKENEPPESWTPEAKEGAKYFTNLGHSLNDLDDGGDMAEEFNRIMKHDSELYK